MMKRDDEQTNGHGKRKRTDPSSTSGTNPKRRRKIKRKLSLREEIRRDLAINPIPVPVVDELVKMLQELENSPSSDADVSIFSYKMFENLISSLRYEKK